ncbi:hypothetical protein T492DRAFT_835970 [Pavlovales sp. CCMP2436]|nr:hypothetical protein T492DRAFT_835970 [Pavlovales sp. CCMP2436]
MEQWIHEPVERWAEAHRQRKRRRDWRPLSTLVVNSCELRKVGLSLEQIGVPVGQPQRARSQRGGAHVVSRPVVAMRSDPKKKYAISALDDERIRAMCERL